LANKVAGFPLDQTDEVRPTIKKSSISGGEEAVKKAKELEDTFVSGAVKNGVPLEIAKKAYQTILVMSGYGFNRCLHCHENINVYEQKGDEIEICVKKLSEVKEGDIVMTRDENKKQDILVPVKKIHRNGKKKLVEVTLSSGQKVKCTLDHKFRVQETNQMLPLREIMKNKLSIVVNSFYTIVEDVNDKLHKRP
jgi:hypothetical protein